MQKPLPPGPTSVNGRIVKSASMPVGCTDMQLPSTESIEVTAAIHALRWSRSGCAAVYVATLYAFSVTVKSLKQSMRSSSDRVVRRPKQSLGFVGGARKDVEKAAIPERGRIRILSAV
jgi:hypothetical protein